jgi:hypothetical protein
MSEPRTASERITAEVTSWPGVEAGLGDRREFAFKVGRRELGHLHGDHPGFAARRIENETDVRDVIELLRLNYDRVVARHGVPAKA